MSKTAKKIFTVDLSDDLGQLFHAFPSQLFHSSVLSALAGRHGLLCSARPSGDLAVMRIIIKMQLEDCLGREKEGAIASPFN